MVSKLININSILLVFIGISTLLACRNPQKYPIEPEISFKQVILSDSQDLLGNKTKIFKLRFGIVDGDGNIGLSDSDSTGIFDPDSLYSNNLFTTLYEIIDGDTIEINPEEQKHFRVPYVQPEGQNKTLIAEIFVDIEYTYDQSGNLPYDKVMLLFFIVDRDIHKSNIQKTPVIKLDTIGIFPLILNEK